MSIKRKIEAVGVPLKDWNINIYRGILTGCNEAFIISGELKDQLIKEDPKSAEIIRPILRGRDIKRYYYEFADLWLISTFPSRHYDIDHYPAVKQFLLSFGIEKLEQTGNKHIINGKEIHARKKTNNKWFETQDSISYWDDFSKQKIVWGEISDKPKFSIDINGQFTPEATAFIMTGENLKYLLCFLNSSLSEYYFAKVGTTTGMGTLRWKKFLIETLPVPRVGNKSISEFESLLNALLSDAQNYDQHFHNMDYKIYSLFNLTDEEISFIESKIKMNGK